MDKPSYQMLVLIATHRLADQAAEMFANCDLPVQYRLNGEGTASSDIMDTLGLGSVDKGILISTVPRSFGNTMLAMLHSQLRLDAVNSGIAFTLPLSGVNTLLLRMMNHIEQEHEHGKEPIMMTDTTYTLITAIVNRGFSAEVMDAARAAGAAGGTVIHSRSISSTEAVNFWGLSAQEEREMVLIMAAREGKLGIMSAISEACGMHSPAKGLVMSLPIDSVMGL